MGFNELFSEINRNFQGKVPRGIVRDLINEYRKEFLSTPKSFSDLLEVLE